MKPRNYLLTFVVLVALVIPFVVAQDTGCCLNPLVSGCVFTNASECCPDDNTSYVGPGEIGPVNMSNCLEEWFYPSDNDSACALMTPEEFPNAVYCEQGCCCERPLETPPAPPTGEPQFPVSAEQKFKLLCLGENQLWFDLENITECSESFCAPELYPPKPRGEACPVTVNNSCDPFNVSDPRVFCKGVVEEGGGYTGRGVCCYREECAAEVPGENDTMVDVCVPTGDMPYNDTSMVCTDGLWVASGEPVGKGMVCAEIVDYAFDGTPILNQVATCEQDLFCKPAIVEETFYICCGEDECGVYTNGQGECANEGATYVLGEESSVEYTCIDGSWLETGEGKKDYGEECDNTLECSEGLACLPYNIPKTDATPEAGIKHCCPNDGTECSSESGCVSEGTKRYVGEDTYSCIGPLWVKESFSPQPWDPCAGGGCGGGGGGSGGGCKGKDKDQDGIPNIEDNCPDDANPDQADMDGDGKGDACDDDIDGDEVLNDEDNCPKVENADQADMDGDGKGDVCDEDIDGDEVLNDEDNCPEVENPDQADLDGDGKGDECDEDIDGDGVLNDEDNCPLNPNPDQKDADNDGLGNKCDDKNDQLVPGIIGGFLIAAVIAAVLASTGVIPAGFISTVGGWLSWLGVSAEVGFAAISGIVGVIIGWLWAIL